MKEQIDRLIALMVDGGMFFGDAVAEFEKRYIRKVLESSGGNQSLAAKNLGMHRNTLNRKMAEYKLNGRNGHHPKRRVPAVKKR